MSIVVVYSHSGMIVSHLIDNISQVKSLIEVLRGQITYTLKSKIGNIYFVNQHENILNTSNAEATLVQSTRTQYLLKTIYTLSCWYPLESSLSTFRWVPMCQGFSHLSGFLHHFVLAKLATSSVRVKPGQYDSCEEKRLKIKITFSHKNTVGKINQKKKKILWTIISE